MPILDFMVASKELDALVAEKVMGWEIVLYHRDATRTPYVLDGRVIDRVWMGSDEPFTPSLNIADAWLIVEKMKDNSYSFAIWDVPGFSSVQPGPIVAFKAHSVYPPTQKDIKAMGYTAPVAICLAALVTLGFIVVKENQYAVA